MKLTKRSIRPKHWQQFIAICLCLLLTMIGTIAVVRQHQTTSRHHTESEAEEDYVDNITQERNYAGTGNGEHITATKSNPYICTDLKGAIPESDMTKNAAIALKDIQQQISNLYNNGQFDTTAPRDNAIYDAATSAASEAATKLSAAAAAAKLDVSLCNFVGILQSGSSQMKTLADQLSQGTATADSLKAAIHYGEVLNQAGLH